MVAGKMIDEKKMLKVLEIEEARLKSLSRREKVKYIFKNLYDQIRFNWFCYYFDKKTYDAYELAKKIKYSRK